MDLPCALENKMGICHFMDKTTEITLCLPSECIPSTHNKKNNDFTLPDWLAAALTGVTFHYRVTD